MLFRSLPSVFINVTDPSSGIKEIEFQILDKTGKVELYSGSAPSVEREAYYAPHVRTKRVNFDGIDASIHCTRLGLIFV